MSPDIVRETVEKARSEFFAGDRTAALRRIRTQANSFKQAGNAAASHQLYRKALEEISVELADIFDQLEISQITELDLSQRGVLDKHMQCVSKLENVKKLDLGFNEISDQGLQNLTALTVLEELCLRNNTTITDDVVANVANLPLLRNLDLRETRLTDQGLNRLAGLLSLKRLLVGKTRVTSMGAASFCDQRPDVEFHW